MNTMPLATEHSFQPAAETPSSSAPALEYMIDAAQRTILFWDVMRRRGNQYEEHRSQTAPHVLEYAVELVIDGRELDRPVNYVLARVIPPPQLRAKVDPDRRPFVIVDPRAGHGPGIGGFKADSEIGVALQAGHPCYFIGFRPDPEPGQTIEDAGRAIFAFAEEVGRRHTEAEGRPVAIGNCQGGWALLMAAAIRPEAFGPLLVAGSPVSTWAGVPGRAPMGYLGELLGGASLTGETGD